MQCKQQPIENCVWIVTGARPILWKNLKLPITNPLDTTHTLHIQIYGYFIFVTNNTFGNVVTLVESHLIWKVLFLWGVLIHNVTFQTPTFKAFYGQVHYVYSYLCLFLYFVCGCLSLSGLDCYKQRVTFLE